MQVVERKAEGLSRHFGVSVPAAELSARLDARIAEIAPTLQLKGFRPGKASPAHVKRMYGKALMGEVVEQAINETSQQLLDEEKLRIAAQPDLQAVLGHGGGARRPPGSRLRPRCRGHAGVRAGRRGGPRAHAPDLRGARRARSTSASPSWRSRIAPTPPATAMASAPATAISCSSTSRAASRAAVRGRRGEGRRDRARRRAVPPRFRGAG